ncbi:MAG: nuclear transport factor 2 family protein [Ferruginibacter sp.]|nr:nuclear transport factor 2 family protein [Ferruginibacter sp.]
MKKLMLLMTAIALVFSCRQPATEKESTGKFVKQYFDHFNRHNWDKMAAMYADTAAFKDPSLGTGIVMQTRRQIAEKYAALQKDVPDVRDSVIQIYPSGDEHVIVEFISKGTAPDGSKFELPVCTIFTFEQGKIIADYTYYDNFEGPN